MFRRKKDSCSSTGIKTIGSSVTMRCQETDIKIAVQQGTHLYLDISPITILITTALSRNRNSNQSCKQYVKGKVDFPQIGFEKRTTERGFSKVSKSV